MSNYAKIVVNVEVYFYLPFVADVLGFYIRDNRGFIRLIDKFIWTPIIFYQVIIILYSKLILPSIHFNIMLFSFPSK